MSSSRGLKKMASTDCSLEPMEVDIRAADMSIRVSRHAVANNLEGTMDLSTRRRNRNSDSSIVQSQPADLSGHRRNSMDTLPTSDQRTRDRPLNNNSVPSRSRPNSVGGTRYSAELSNHRRQSRSSNSSSSAITHISHQQPTSLVSDVIVLSDEDAPRINGHVNGFSTDSHPDSPESDLPEPLATLNRAQTSKVAWLTPEERVKKELSLRRLQEELRNEEMKLVLLKKLRQSQLVKESLITPPTAVQQAPIVTPASKLTGMVGGRTSSPQNSSVSASNSLLSRSTSKLHSQQSQSLLQPMVKNQSQSQSMGSGSRSGSNSLPPSIMLQQNMLRNSGLLGRTPVTTPPNVVMGYPMQSSQGSKTSAHNSSSSVQQPSSTSSPTPQQISGQLAQAERIETQTPAQRQAAAKLALRKQLEKTLLQIPPPKPPPPEMHFIPNANNQEFVYLVGLEVVVGLLVGDERCNKPPPDPFTCVQCATDFTPVWKWQDAGEKKKPPAVICESCVTTNIKKALKAEHTNRLKTAFVKALQQEQEIEQRMSQGSTSPPLPISTPPPPVITTSSCATPSSAINHRASTPPNSRSPIPTSFNRSSSGLGASSAAAANAVAAAVANSAALLQQMPKLTAAHQSLLQVQHLQQLAQSLPGHPPQPAHGLPFGPLLAAQAYSYQMLGKSSLSSSDLQRQYLLDMIPPRSMSQNSMNWKTRSLITLR